jgi:DNA-binding LacI/PurR family transcriptional regulator
LATTIKDVAKRAGVSSATVSRVLADHPHVSAEVRIKVQEVVHELGYQPSRVARSFRVKKTKIIGLIVSDIMNPFFTSLVRTIEDFASQKGYAVILCNTDEDLSKEKNYIESMLSEGVAGVLIAPAREKNCTCNKLFNAGIPIVCIDRKLENIQVDTVLVDNFAGAYKAVEHLVRMGHRKIGALIGEYTTTGLQREDGFRKALQDNLLPVEESLMQRGCPKEETGRALAAVLLEMASPPTAIFCGNNLLTLGAMNEIFSRGLRVPNDIALVGFDDLEWYGLVDPGITAVRQPTHEIAMTAIDLLFRRIEGDLTPSSKVILPTELHIRSSSAMRVL